MHMDADREPEIQPKGQQEEEKVRNLSALIQQLDSSNLAARTAAAKSLVERGTPGIQALLSVFTVERKTLQAQWNRNQVLVLLCYLGLLIGLLIATLSQPTIHPDWGFIGIGGIVAETVAAALFIYGFQRRLMRRFDPLLRAVTSLEDVHAVGPLLDTLDLTRNQTNKTVIQALLRLLPCMKATDVQLLTAGQRQRMSKALRHCIACLALMEYDRDFDVSFALAILKAFEQIGDKREVELVRMYAQGQFGPNVKIKNGRPASVDLRWIQEAAQACLPFLQERIELERAAKTLLRASDSPKTGPQALLRPAMEAPKAAPEELLRASVSENKPV